MRKKLNCETLWERQPWETTLAYASFVGYYRHQDSYRTARGQNIGDRERTVRVTRVAGAQ